MSLSLTSCEKGWSDGASVGLGCLYFERGESMTYSEAKQYCNTRDSDLLELETEDQMEYVGKLTPVPGNYWWGGASDEDREGEWAWQVSGKQVERWAWGDKGGKPNPNNKKNFFALFKGSNYFHGVDLSKEANANPVCEKRVITTAIESCEDDWIDKRSVGLGCLYIDKKPNIFAAVKIQI